MASMQFMFNVGVPEFGAQLTRFAGQEGWLMIDQDGARAMAEALLRAADGLDHRDKAESAA